MKGNQFGEVLLHAFGKPGALLRGRGQKGIGGNVKQSWPALPKGSGNLRDAKLLKGKRPAEIFVETDRGIDIAGQLLQYIRRAGRRGNDLRHPGTVLPFRADG